MTEPQPGTKVRVWDRFVRSYHWGQAALIAAAWLTADGLRLAHEWFGYTLAVLLAARVVWGLVGPRTARFSDFVRGPGAVMAYLRDLRAGRAPHYLGHNPAGGAMILALMASIAGTALTGWLMETDRFWGSSAVEGLHEGLATLMLVLVVVHLLGVVVESFRQRENLVAAMITGEKTVPR